VGFATLREVSSVSTNLAPESPRDGRRFSKGWCYGVALLHFAVTLVLHGLYSLTSIRDTLFAKGLVGGLQMLWSPFSFYLSEVVKDPDLSSGRVWQLGLIFLWSWLLGIAAGFSMPAMRRGRDPAKLVSMGGFLTLPCTLIPLLGLQLFKARTIEFRGLSITFAASQFFGVIALMFIGVGLYRLARAKRAGRNDAEEKGETGPRTMIR
jgi:hypothetical protein